MLSSASVRGSSRSLQSNQGRCLVIQHHRCGVLVRRCGSSVKAANTAMSSGSSDDSADQHQQQKQQSGKGAPVDRPQSPSGGDGPDGDDPKSSKGTWKWASLLPDWASAATVGAFLASTCAWLIWLQIRVQLAPLEGEVHMQGKVAEERADKYTRLLEAVHEELKENRTEVTRRIDDQGDNFTRLLATVEERVKDNHAEVVGKIKDIHEEVKQNHTEVIGKFEDLAATVARIDSSMVRIEAHMEVGKDSRV